MERFVVPDHFRLYCRRADAVHVFRPAGKVVICETDGYRLHAANIVAWYASDDGVVTLPERLTDEQ